MNEEFKIRQIGDREEFDPDKTARLVSVDPTQAGVAPDRDRRLLSDDRQAADPLETSKTGPATTPAAGLRAATAAVMARERVTDTTQNAPLFPSEEATDFKGRWDGIQVRFIDEPRRCVQEADVLVAEAINRLSQVFGSEREKLEQEWDHSGNVSTEDLRLALQRYRSFFGRLMQAGVADH